MNLLYTGRTPTEAHLLAAILGEHGIACELRGEPLWVDREPQLTRKVFTTTVWVNESDEAAATELASEFQASQIPETEEWHCPHCHERSPALFDECWNCGAMRGAAEPAASAAPAGDAAFSAASEIQPVSSPTAVPWTMPWITLLVTAICFLVCHGLSNEPDPQADSSMNLWGWRSAHDVWGGAWWSLLTAAFVHADFDHLWGNIAWLWIFGLRLEQAIGAARWLLFLLVSAVVSVAVDLAWLGEHSYGLSGVTNAAFGLFVIAAVERRLMPVWLWIPICVAFAWEGTILDLADIMQEVSGGWVPNPIANVCHLAGALFGILSGLAFLQPWRLRFFRGLLFVFTIGSLVPIVWSPWSADWLISRGDAALERLRIDDALIWWDRAEQRRPDDPRPLWRKALVLLEREEFSSALQAADAAVALEEALIQKVEASAPASPVEEGVEDAPSTGPSPPDPKETEAPETPKPQLHEMPLAVTGRSFMVRGRIRLALSQGESAINDFNRALEIAPDDVSVLMLRAIAFWEQSRWGDAFADLVAVGNLTPKDIEYRLLRGAFLKERAEFLAAQDNLQLAIDLLHRQPGAPDAVRLVSLAQAHFWLGEYESTLSSLEEATKQTPATWEVILLRADARWRLGKFEEALADAERVVKVNARSALAWTTKGNAHDGLGQHDKAIEAYGLAIQINPRLSAAFVGRAVAHRNRGELAASLEDLDRAIALNSRMAEAYLERSETNRLLKNRRSAAADRQTALALDPSLDSAPMDDEP